jgi:hypothetical protein
VGWEKEQIFFVKCLVITSPLSRVMSRRNLAPSSTWTRISGTELEEAKAKIPLLAMASAASASKDKNTYKSRCFGGNNTEDLKISTLSREHPIVVIKDFLSPSECAVSSFSFARFHILESRLIEPFRN